MCDPSTGETERRPSRLYFNDSPPSGGGFYAETAGLRAKLREPAGLRKVGPVSSPPLDRLLRVPPLHVDAPNRIAQDADRQAPANAVERSRPNTVIGRESADEQLVHAEFVQGGLQVPPLNREGLERGVRVHLRVHPLRQDHRPFRDFQVGMESGTLRPLDAVHRPCSPEFLEVLRLPRMPIPREDHRQPATSEQGDRAVHPRDNCIALRHPERSAWTEVILDVDDEQRGPLPHGPDRPNVTVAKSLRPPEPS